MSAIIEKYLYDIDQSFAEKSEKDVKLIYAMVFVVLVMFSYLVFWESAEKGYKDIQAASKVVQDKIAVDKQYLLMHPESQITKLNQEIKQLNERLVLLKGENVYIKAEIEKIPELFYDEEIWGGFIDSIAEHAKRHKVKLTYFSNRLADDKTKFGHVLNIDIKSEGKYQNIIRFMNSIEKSKLVVDIHDLDMNASNKINLDLNLSVWGITY